MEQLQFSNCEYFKSDSISIEDDEEMQAINPYDFLNESFLNEFCRETRTSESSSSNISIKQELTPPISPQQSFEPVVFDSNFFVGICIPVPDKPSPNEGRKKMKPICPKITQKSSFEKSSSDSDSKINTPVDKAMIKQARLIRNRESALLSRRKKKEYLELLEKENGKLKVENSYLKEENSILRERLNSYSNLTCRCASSLSSKLPTKNASLLLALVLMVGFNLIPLGNYLSATNAIRKTPEQTFHSRHLLYAENSTLDTNSSETIEDETTTAEVPKYLNQTDRILKENIENIRKWIPDLRNTSLMQGIEKGVDPFEDIAIDGKDQKLKKMYEKSQLKLKKKSPKRKISDVPVYNPEFFKLHEFFEEINRKDDTFYVFSFKSDHLLLPAIQNISHIIKMNLLMPQITNVSLTNATEKITMMQIETIILNTSLISIKSIPDELIKNKTYGNSTTPLCNQPAIHRKQQVAKENNAKFIPYFSSLNSLRTETVRESEIRFK